MLKESGDSLKNKIEVEVEAAVKRMGFAKKLVVAESVAKVFSKSNKLLFPDK